MPGATSKPSAQAGATALLRDLLAEEAASGIPETKDGESWSQAAISPCGMGCPGGGPFTAADGWVGGWAAGMWTACTGLLVLPGSLLPTPEAGVPAPCPPQFLITHAWPRALAPPRSGRVRRAGHTCGASGGWRAAAAGSGAGAAVRRSAGGELQGEERGGWGEG